MPRFTLLLVLILALAAPTFATTLIPAVDQTTFASSLTGLQQIDFDIAGSFQDYSVTGFTVGGATFSNIGGSADTDLYIATYAPLSLGFGGALAMPCCGAPHLLITFATPVSGVGFLAKGYNATAFTFSVPGSNAVITANVSDRFGSPTWIGVTSDTPFTSISISTNLDRGLIDKLQFGIAGSAPDPDPGGAETPELATMLMIGVGLLSIRTLKRYASLNFA